MPPDAEAVPSYPRPGLADDVVVYCDVPGAFERIRARFPSLDIVDISSGLPPGKRGDVLFGGWSAHSVGAMDTGVHWVQFMGTGLDGVPQAVKEAPLLTTARGSSAVAISEYVLATMGAFSRNFPQSWLREPPEYWFAQPATPLAGATLGLVGFGGIAQRLACLALALDMSVMALRRQALPSPLEGVVMAASLADLVSVADHLVLAAPATDATRHVFNDESLALCKPGVHLVNIARGALVDHDALRRALDNGTIARASLDVTEPEPLPAGHWLYEHPKVFLTPHASWAGPPAFEASTDLFCDNLVRYLRGELLHGVVGSDGY